MSDSQLAAQTQVASTATKSPDTKPVTTSPLVVTTAKKVPVIDRSQAEKHPLWPALELAVDSYKHIRAQVKDYSCTVVRRERVNGVLLEHEYMQAKVRHSRSRDGKEVIPFSVYLKFLAPSKVKGREVLFVNGEHNGEMQIRNGGQKLAFVTTTLKPNSDLALRDNRYPITEFGFENLVRRLIEVAKEDIVQSEPTQVDFFHDAKVDGRSCTGVRVTHPKRSDRLRFHTATVFMDTDLKVPIHYEAYDWPNEEGEEPELLEQYTYRDIRINQGYDDNDFDKSNSEYNLK